MDLRLFLRVLGRFRLLIVGAFVLALLLAIVSYWRVDFTGGAPRFEPRQSEQWVSYSRLFVTQPGFKWGNSLDPRAGGIASESDGLSAQRAVEERFITLAVIYANLVTSDAVSAIMRRDGPVKGRLEAAALPVTPGSDDLLPIISIAGFAETPAASRAIAARAAHALRTYIEAEQTQNDIPRSERVVLTSVNKAGNTTLFQARRKTVPIVAFLTVMLAAIALAFVLENLRPRMQPASDVSPITQVRPEALRRSAP
jgi:hypothetical protein